MLEECGGGCKGPCSIVAGYDAARRAEYIEVECRGCASLDALAVKMWRMRAQSFTAAAWDNIRLEYDESGQRYVYSAGRYIPRSWESVSNALEYVVGKYLKYFYARGFAAEPLQGETGSGARPRPQTGFVDMSISNLAAYLFALDVLRSQTKVTLQGGAPRTVNVLLADLGDSGMALREAIQTLYEVSIVSGCEARVKLRLNAARLAERLAEKSGDIIGWLHRLLVVEVLYSLAQESIELLPRWPSIAVVHYGRQGDPEDTRFLDYVVVGGEDLLLAYYSIAGAAGELGVATWRLLEFLDKLPHCILEAGGRGLLRDNEVSGLVSRLAPVYDSVLQGFVDRDALYQVVRPLFAKNVSSISSCSSAAAMLSGW